MNLKANNIILTGATRGLGLSHAHCLAKQGYNLAIVDISEDACSVYGETDSVESLKKSLTYDGNKIEFYACDLTDAETTKKVFTQINEDFGSIGGLVANAGGDVSGNDSRASGGKATNNSILISQENHDQIFDRNYLTCFNSLRAVIPHMQKNKYGKIVTTSSISAGYGVDKETAYSVAKAAVAHLTRCVAVELRDFDINVNCISPGGTLTGRFQATIKDRSKEDKEKIFNEDASFLKKPADPAYISSVVKFLISEDSDYISGQVVRIDGGQITSPV